jgi:hypothetical protein
MNWEYLQPSSRVIGLERDNQISSLLSLRVERHERSIATRRIVELESHIITVGTSTLCEDKGVVAVEMDRVRQSHRRLNDDINPLLELGNLDGKVARVARDGVVPVDAAESWVAPLGLEGVAIECPLEEVGRVGTFANKDVLVDLGCLGASEERSDGNELLVRFIDALVNVFTADCVRGAIAACVVHNALDVS